MKIKTSRPIMESKSCAHGGGRSHGTHKGKHISGAGFTWNGRYCLDPMGACYMKNVEGRFIPVACGVPSVAIM